LGASFIDKRPVSYDDEKRCPNGYVVDYPVDAEDRVPFFKIS
jgi:hypothetical protein